MSEKLLLVVNPRSGREKAKVVLFDLIRIFTESGKEVTVYPTSHKESTITYIKNNAPKYDLVVTCGGDGTLNETINAIMQCGKRVPIGYIPLGSTNDFATSLDIPTDCMQAAEKIIQGTLFPYDVGSINGKYFSYIACAGAFAETSYMTSQSLKNKLGHFAYLLSSVKSLSTLRKTTMPVSTPVVTLTEDYLFTAFANSMNAGGILNLSNGEIVFNDGLFELLLIKMPKDIIDFSTLIKDLLNAELSNRNISLHKISECHISLQKGTGWSLDGEDGGQLTDIDFKVHKEAIDIIL
jgi:diacylglycerol kinase (ATP)